MKKGQYKHTPESLRKAVETRRKNGSYVAWNKGMKWSLETILKQSLDKGNNWKGDRVGYSGIHKRISKYFIKTNCDWCGDKKLKKNGRLNLQWANKSGRYLFVRNDWLCLCPKCHKKQEKTVKSKRLRNLHGKLPTCPTNSSLRKLQPQISMVLSSP